MPPAAWFGLGGGVFGVGAKIVFESKEAGYMLMAVGIVIACLALLKYLGKDSPTSESGSGQLEGVCARSAPNGSRSMSSAAKGLAFLGSEVLKVTLTGRRFSAGAVQVANMEQDYPKTFYNLQALVTHAYGHNGDTIKIQSALRRRFANRVPEKIQSSISLSMQQQVDVFLFVADPERKRFTTLSQWPYKSDAEYELPFGKWRTTVTVSCAKEDETITCEYMITLNPDLTWKCDIAIPRTLSARLRRWTGRRRF